MARDVFDAINNAVLDLQSAGPQHYERPLKKLAQLLQREELKDYNEELTEGLDLDDFISRSSQTGGSFVGSARLLWPDDEDQVLGLQLLLVLKLGEEEDFLRRLSFLFYSSSNIATELRLLTNQLIIPFARDYKSHVKSKQDPQEKTNQLRSDRPASLVNYGVMVMNSQNVSMEKIQNLIKMAPDERVGQILGVLQSLAKEIASADIPKATATEMLENVEALAEQASLAPSARKLGLVRASWKQLVEYADDLDKVSKLSSLLVTHGPSIAGFFEMVLKQL